MVADERLLDLLTDWEEDYQRGVVRSAEELCPDDVELQAALRERIHKRRRIHEMLDTAGEPSHDWNPLQSLPKLEGFEILQMLGAGGMGVVYKARHVALNRLVALKMVLSGPLASEQELHRFRAEAEAVARLQHPHIVQIYEIGQQQGRPYLTLEFVSGGSLAHLLQGKPLPAQRAAELLKQVARGVHHAHQHGIVHRDLKPGNILVTEQGVPKVTDFGLAKRLRDDPGLTQPGAILGSPCYMAPEQAESRGTEIGPATDIYALGVILYEMLTGRPPFQGTSMMETLDQVRALDPVPPRTFQPRIAADLETICLKCLEKRPQDRYASAEALAQDLERFLAGEPITAKPLSAMDTVLRTLQRKNFDPKFTQFGFWLLMVSPLPFFVALTIFLFFRDSAHFARIVGWTFVALIFCIQCFMDLMNLAVLRVAPPSQRRHLLTVFWGLWLSMVAIWLVVQVALPPEPQERLLIAFPLWIIMAGCANLALAFENGVHYVAGATFWLIALAAAWFLPWAPLIAGGLASSNMFIQGFIFFRLARRLEQEKAIVSQEAKTLPAR